jgi:hypothetical protein
MASRIEAVSQRMENGKCAMKLNFSLKKVVKSMNREKKMNLAQV